MKAKTFILIVVALFSWINFAESADLSKREAWYYKVLNKTTVLCELCPNFCSIKNGARGICGVRKNEGGKLYSLVYAKPCSVKIDPIEKKPFFHVAPGSKALSIATVGCNLRCLFCQNWQISQSSPERARTYDFSPEDIISLALKRKTKVISYTYTEPTVFYEYMFDTAKLAKEKGLFNSIHSYGYINPEPLRQLCEYLDAANIDLKGFDEDFYKKMGVGSLAPVLEAIKILKDEGVWLEITNLLIPSANDDPQKVRQMCAWISENLGNDVPVHFSRFHPAYKLQRLPATPVKTLETAKAIAEEEGLKYVYIGNVPGHPAESTYCPDCKKVIIKRRGYILEENNIVDGKCKHCSAPVAGIWKLDTKRAR